MKFIKSIYWGSVIFWLVVFSVILLCGNESYVVSPYLLKGYRYDSYLDLFATLFLKDNNLTLFEKCCDIINYIGRNYGYSYQDINIIIFVIISPLLMLNLIVISASQFFFILSKK